jgi:hypothetical protein
MGILGIQNSHGEEERGGPRRSRKKFHASHEVRFHLDSCIQNATCHILFGSSEWARGMTKVLHAGGLDNEELFFYMVLCTMYVRTH